MPDPKDPLHVSAHEREIVRVFALDLAPQAVAGFAEKPAGNGGDWPLQEALGATVLDASHIEVFPADDLNGVGLANYLIEGQGVAAATVAPDRAMLDAEAGHIVLIRSRSFGGTEQHLSPRPPLRHLVTYAMASAEPAHVPIPTPAELMETPPAAPVAPGPAPRHGGALVVILAAVALLVLLVAVFGIRGPF